MELSEREVAVEAIITRLSEAHWSERDAIREELLSMVKDNDVQVEVQDYLERRRKELPLEVRWEIDEVLETLIPEPEQTPEVEETEEPPPEPEGQLSMSDLTMVYDDPRGLVLYRTKTGDRWLASQANPNTGQPQMFELSSDEVGKLKEQLAGSPYWVLGSGA